MAKKLGATMRIIHRYLGFFLTGIMAVYATTGTVLILRDTDFLKEEIRVEKQLKPNISKGQLGKVLKIRSLKVEKEVGDVLYFREGTYNKKTGIANYTIKKLPRVLEKMTHLHKAKTGDPLFFLNIFFAASLLFFVISAFWMFIPKTTIFRKGLYFTLAGIILTLILIYIK